MRALPCLLQAKLAGSGGASWAGCWFPVTGESGRFRPAAAQRSPIAFATPPEVANSRAELGHGQPHEPGGLAKLFLVDLSQGPVVPACAQRSARGSSGYIPTARAWVAVEGSFGLSYLWAP